MIRLSVSVSPIRRNEDKNNFKFNKYHEIEVSVDQLSVLIRQGYGICQVFEHGGKTFGNSTKSNKHFKEANYLILDCDAVELSMDEMDKVLCENGLAPTLIHPTANNGIQKKEEECYFNRYHVIFFLNEPIKDVQTYKSYIEGLRQRIIEICGVDIMENDTTNGDASHFYCGNCDCCVLTHDTAYDLNQLPYVETEHSRTHGKGQNKPKIIYELPQQVEKDFNEMDFASFNEKYQGFFMNIENNAQLDDDSLITLVNENDVVFKENKFRHLEKYTNADGTVWFRYARLKDGERRRKAMFVYALKCRVMNRQVNEYDMPFEEVLFSLVWFLERHIDNSEDPISKNDVLAIAQSVMNADMDEYAEVCDDKKRCYVINHSYARKNMIRFPQRHALAAYAKAKGKEKFDIFMSCYDPSLTNAQNAQNMGISVSTLHRFKKLSAPRIGGCVTPNINMSENEHARINTRYDTPTGHLQQTKDNNSKNNKHKNKNDMNKLELEERIKTLYDSKLSTRENIKNMEDMGLKVSKGTLYRWLKKQSGAVEKQSGALEEESAKKSGAVKEQNDDMRELFGFDKITRSLVGERSGESMEYVKKSVFPDDGLDSNALKNRINRAKEVLTDPYSEVKMKKYYLDVISLCMSTLVINGFTRERIDLEDNMRAWYEKNKNNIKLETLMN